MRTALAIGVMLAFGISAGLVVRSARQGRLARRWLVGLSGACAVGLGVMAVTDWPAESLDHFWASHAVVSATLTSVLLVGAGFLAFEAQDNLEQQHLTESLATAAFGGLVDHMLDVDIAMAMLFAATPPGNMTVAGKPLRWLRDDRDRLLREEGGDDPRQAGQERLAETEHHEWRREIVDQSVRRIMAAMRDWSPLLCQTRDGTGVLARIGNLRNDLLALGDHLHPSHYDQARAVEAALWVRAECTVLALGLELGSNVPADRTRAGVVTANPPGLPSVHADLQRLRALARKDDLRKLRSELARHKPRQATA